MVVGEEGLVDVVDVEVGPVGGGGDEFGVGTLPEEEVGEAHLAGGADDEVGVREAGGVEVMGKEGVVYLVRGYAFGDDAADGLHDLGAAAVVEGDADGHAVVVFGEVDGVQDLLLELGVQFVQAADVEEADAVFVEVFGLALNDAGKD